MNLDVRIDHIQVPFPVPVWLEPNSPLRMHAQAGGK